MIGKKEFARTRLELEARRDLAFAGLVVVAFCVFLFLSISYQLVFTIYAVLSIFIFSSYLVIWSEGAGDEKHLPAPKRYPSVSIVIPSYNSKATIFRCIDACKKMEYPSPFEIIVVEDGSTDGSYELLKKEKGIRLLKNPRNMGKSCALNCGIAAAKGEVIGCVDSDTYPEKDTLLKAMKHFYEKENVGAVVVFICVNEPKTILQRIQEIEYWVSFGFFFRVIAHIDGIYVTPGPTAFYRKSVLEKLGGFDEKNLSEDLEIALRMQKMGYRIAACHDARVWTEVPSDLYRLYRQRLRWYRGGIMNMLRYSDLFFNPKHGDFGFFVLPTMLGSGFFAALFTAWTLFFWGRNLLDWISPFFFNLSGGLAAGATGIAYGLLTFQSAWILGIFSMAIWTYFLVKSFEIADEKIRARHLLPLLLLLWVYPFFIGFVFLVSYLYELFGVKYTW
ncbi:MAG: glycosyltransferase family 2 protein [Candidatus Micrarchaeota archaeon]|nr:glycosyltransferase family 2 protein [Candidatus Micrarchaeota archaeon]